jgi:hypothetical protein
MKASSAYLLVNVLRNHYGDESSRVTRNGFSDTSFLVVTPDVEKANKVAKDLGLFVSKDIVDSSSDGW